MDKYLRNKKIKLHSKSDIEFHEVFLDKLVQRKEEETIGVLEEKIEVPLLKRVFQGFLFFVFLLLFIFFVKTFYIQIIQGERFSALAEGNKFIIHQVQAGRGVIFDRSLNQLVFNRPSFDLVLDIRNLPQDEDEKSRVLKEVSGIIDKNVENFKKEIKENNDQFIVVKDLDHQILILFETKISDFPGFQIQRNITRYYQNGKIFSHLIGHTGKITPEELDRKERRTIFDWVGRKGIERYYEEILRENPGELQIKRDALGRIISKEIISLPKPGESLVLWLDSGLQKKIKQELGEMLETVGSNAGTAVALDPRTGGVLAMVSLPSFDNNLFQRGGDSELLRTLLEDPLGQQPLFNRVISGQYAPGSTIKTLIALAALEENLICPEKQIYSDGKIEIPSRYQPGVVYTFRDWMAHGWTNMRKAIADSVNIYFYAIGGGYQDQKGLGPVKMKKYLEMFGWGERTGIDIPGEARGLVPSPAWRREVKGKDWWLGHNYFFAIGQGDVLTTPLQLTTSMVPIANRGRLLQPQVVKEIVSIDENGSIKTERKIDPKVIRENFVNPENLEVVREGMRQAVTHGTVRLLDNLPVKVAAKTGTAETPVEGYYHHWVTLFAPYDNPEIVMTFMIESIEGIRPATVPVAHTVLDWYFTDKENYLE